MECQNCGSVIDQPAERGDYRCACGYLETFGREVRDLRRRPFNRPVERARWKEFGQPTRTRPEIDETLNLCRQCPEYRGANYDQDEHCHQSGVDLSEQIYYSTTSCPLGHWGPPRLLFVMRDLGKPGKWWHPGHVALLERDGFVPLLWLVGPRGADLDELQAAIADTSPKLVVFRAFCISSETLARLAKQNRATRFVVVCHSSQSHLGNLMPKQLEFLDLADVQPNVHYATVDERNVLGAALAKPATHVLPNYCQDPLPKPSTPPNGPPWRVSLIARNDPVKNIENQILAMAIAGRDVPIEAHICIRGWSPYQVDRLCGRLRLRATPVPWLEHSEHLERVGTYHVGLQCSFTESFNYVAYDHLAVGCPVIGSPVIRFLPRELQVDPDDPEAIARRLVLVVKTETSGNPVLRDAALIAARKVAERNNAAYVAALRRLCEG